MWAYLVLIFKNPQMSRQQLWKQCIFVLGLGIVRIFFCKRWVVVVVVFVVLVKSFSFTTEYIYSVFFSSVAVKDRSLVDYWWGFTGMFKKYFSLYPAPILKKEREKYIINSIAIMLIHKWLEKVYRYIADLWKWQSGVLSLPWVYCLLTFKLKDMALVDGHGGGRTFVNLESFWGGNYSAWK